MSAEITFHPDEGILQQYCRGQLSVGMSVVVSAHVELCPRCSKSCAAFEQTNCQEWLDSVESDSGLRGIDLENVISSITSQPQQYAVANSVPSLDAMHLPHCDVALPRALSAAISNGLVWKKLAGGINQAGVDLDTETQCEFLYMKPGSQTPLHTHQGSEATLVLDGGFEDEMGHYEFGDFILNDRKVVHRPRSEQGCLCFAVLDSPLTFTQGLARLLNPFNSLRFRRALARARG